MKKKILFLHASADLYGSDYVLLNLIKSLDKEKFSPFVLIPYKGKLCSEFEANRIDYQICELPVLRRNVFSFIGIINFIILNIKAFFLLSRMIKKEGFEIIHTNTSAIWIGGITARVFKKKHIWQVMELVEKPKIVSYMMRKIVGLFSTKVYTISEAVKTFYIKKNINRKEKFEVLYHGVDLKIYDPFNNQGKEIRKKMNISEETILIGMAGRINSWKGHDVFVKSIPLVLSQKNSKDSVYFVLLGDSFKGQEQYESELTDLIATLGIGSSLKVLGFQNDLQDWIAAMDIFILPSKLPEPNATVTIAAMAMKKPVIATKIGGTVETVIDNETGLLIPPNDEVELANKITYLMIDKEKINVLGENGYQRVIKSFSLQNYCNVITKEYLKS